ncbi:hypothetical protein L1987_24001 [Smallanthus sonchifolius]|uniref:Uncharacterized protein n=1 Tax=Smallanthus sonchifolius TaxID=185202 RepID=A0ACB9IKQ4_9ASTR|nr:hypothetical protein L1987_24001 [Smallanthus sonchifolius]
MMTRGKGVAQVSEHDYPKKKHKSTLEGLDEDILNMLSEASRNEISFLKTQVMSFREREDDREREITELRDMVVNQNQVIESMKKTIEKVDAVGSGGSASGEGNQGSSGAKDKSVLEVVEEGDKGDDDNDDEADNDQVMVYPSMMPDTTENPASICATILNQEVRVTEDTIREVLNNGDERRHKINANMDDIIACFNRMGYMETSRRIWRSRPCYQGNGSV